MLDLPAGAIAGAHVFWSTEARLELRAFFVGFSTPSGCSAARLTRLRRASVIEDPARSPAPRLPCASPEERSLAALSQDDLEGAFALIVAHSQEQLGGEGAIGLVALLAGEEQIRVEALVAAGADPAVPGVNDTKTSARRA
jgi:hypothetical protein